MAAMAYMIEKAALRSVRRGQGKQNLSNKDRWRRASARTFCGLTGSGNGRETEPSRRTIIERSALPHQLDEQPDGQRTCDHTEGQRGPIQPRLSK